MFRFYVQFNPLIQYSYSNKPYRSLLFLIGGKSYFPFVASCQEVKMIIYVFKLILTVKKRAMQENF